MYAVIETGGKQYRVTPGESVEIETLDGEVGAEVEFNRVLVKRKKQYKRTIGHRQNYTRVLVSDIVA